MTWYLLVQTNYSPWRALQTLEHQEAVVEAEVVAEEGDVVAEEVVEVREMSLGGSF